MRLTIDKAGRVVVPKPLRDELCLEPGVATSFIFLK
jgi:AbrB family looped-hinge helix DNA binding protein